VRILREAQAVHSAARTVERAKRANRNEVSFSAWHLISLSQIPAVNGVDITIADAGPGIPESDRGRVQERFVKLDSTRSTPGSGLGLAIVAACAKLYGGSLVLQDNEPACEPFCNCDAGVSWFPPRPLDGFVAALASPHFTSATCAPS
jgi:signal transduction histidine kinase